MDVRRAAAIAGGAAVGAGVRWALTRALGPDGIDVALLTVNLAGALALAALSAARPGTITGRTEALLGAGFCGALTTWSSLALRTASQYRAGSWATPSAWLALNVIAAAILVVIVRQIMRGTWKWPQGMSPDGSGTNQ